jgi:hypothetical protein
MKPVFIIFSFSFLLTFTAEMNAQTAQQNAPNTAKAATTPSSKPTTGTAKVKKPVKSTTKSNKGLFNDDFDGGVGIKYIGTEPVSEEELAKVRDAKRVDKPVKRTHKPEVEGETAATTEVKPPVKAAKVSKPMVQAEVIGTTEVKPAVKAAKVSKPMVQTEVTGTTEVKPAAQPTKVSKPVVKPEIQAATTSTTEVKQPAEKPVKVVSKPVVKPVDADVTTKAVKPATEVKPTPQVSVPTPQVAPPTQEVVVAKTVVTTPVVAAPVIAKTVVTTPKPVVRPSKPTTRGARIEFDAITINLGNVKEDAILERYFEFTNTGGSDLEILECRGSCGCVQPRALSTIVGPGEKGKILVKYTARNKVGPQRPVVTITTNGTPSVIRLFVEAWVDQIPGGVKDTIVTPKGESN